jgi:hypothetical protein
VEIEGTAIRGDQVTVRPVLDRRGRIAAWVVTGPLGHAWAGAVDWIVLLVAWRRSRGGP